MIRRPPRSTPFPTRRSSDLEGKSKRRRPGILPYPTSAAAPDHDVDGVGGEDRSEEHTSELQSHSDLVCRLLLEKKKKKQKKKCNKKEHKHNHNLNDSK